MDYWDDGFMEWCAEDLGGVRGYWNVGVIGYRDIGLLDQWN